jgi:glyoxylase-like metal-dependent hydrolase (beta-lactamase superfamily II)
MKMFSKEIVDGLWWIYLGKLDSNVYVVDGSMVVDSTTGLLKNHLVKQLEKIGLRINSVERVVNTHLHFDHIGGNYIFSKALVGMHESDANELKKNPKATYHALFGGSIKRRGVDFLLKDNHKLKTENFTFLVVHTPGHTKGSICLYEPHEKILISGDTIFHHSVGRVDLIGGSEDNMLNSLQKIKELDVDILLPGHGRIIERDTNEHIARIVEGFANDVGKQA